MDYNNIQARLTRTFSSLNDRFDEDIDKHTNIEHRKNGKGFSMTFGSKNPEIVLNKIMSILHNLSSLKDHLKNCLTKNGYDPKLVEQEIDNSLHLQVLLDIINQEKHGSPLKRPRSNKNPIIDDPTNSFRLGSKTGSPNEAISNDISPTMFIDAFIRDDKGNLLFYLDELVETCFLKWQDIAEKYNCG